MIHVIVADNHAVRLYEAVAAPGQLAALAEFPSYIATHERDLGSDRPGRTVAGIAGIRHSYEPSTRPKDVAQQRWLRAVGSSIGSLLVDRKNETIVLVAAPRMLARLKAALPERLLARVAAEVRRDLCGVPNALLTKRLSPTLRAVMLRQGTLPPLHRSDRIRLPSA